ncbi:hypothetical protein H110_02441 [Trichophyton rubrum MR1448]|nr:hypothetical protein H110_02441 [Trichophyton rubrum MR1448]
MQHSKRTKKKRVRMSEEETRKRKGQNPKYSKLCSCREKKKKTCTSSYMSIKLTYNLVQILLGYRSGSVGYGWCSATRGRSTGYRLLMLRRHCNSITRTSAGTPGARAGCSSRSRHIGDFLISCQGDPFSVLRGY